MRKDLDVSLNDDVEGRFCTELDLVAGQQAASLEVAREFMKHRSLKEAKHTDRLQKLVKVGVERCTVVIVMRLRRLLRRQVGRMNLADRRLADIFIPIPMAIAQP